MSFRAEEGEIQNGNYWFVSSEKYSQWAETKEVRDKTATASLVNILR